MSKPMSLFFAVVSILLMSATAVSISHNLWYTLALGIATVAFIGFGFALKARVRKREQPQA